MIQLWSDGEPFSARDVLFTYNTIISPDIYTPYSSSFRHIEFDKIYREIFKEITDDNAYLFLVIPNSITVVNKKIEPVSPSIIGVMHNAIEWIKKL